MSWATACVVVAAWGVPVGHAQPPGRRVTTLEALSTSAIFFHGQQVIVRAEVVGEGVLAYLVDSDNRLLALDVPPPPAGRRERFEIVGTFYDIGRLEPDDPRVADEPFGRLAKSLLNKPWPGVGELPVLVASSTRPAAAPTTATLRTVALNPMAYLDQNVTVTGRFRGRNLYGDLPGSPGESSWDFVLASAAAAVWVVGKEPKGDGFELDVQARIDTGRWLQVTGRVRLHAGMVLLEAGDLALADPPASRERRTVSLDTRQGPPPEVIFSAPLPDDTDVPRDTQVRLQFSRDMNPDSFKNRIAIAYSTVGSVDREDLTPPEVGFQFAYRRRNRVLEITLTEELERFRTLDVALLDGIAATDGARLEPWTLSFFIGG